LVGVATQRFAPGGKRPRAATHPLTANVRLTITVLLCNGSLLPAFVNSVVCIVP